MRFWNSSSMIVIACDVRCVACSPFGTIIGIVPSSMYGSGSSGICWLSLLWFLVANTAWSGS